MGKKLLYGGLFLAGVSVGSWTTAFSSSLVRMRAYQRYLDQTLTDLRNDCDAYEEKHRDRPEVLRPPITIRSEGMTQLVFPEVYCPAKTAELEKQIKELDSEKLNPFNIWR